MVLRNRDLFNYLRTNNISIAKNAVVKTSLFKFVKSATTIQWDTNVEDHVRLRVNVFNGILCTKWVESKRTEQQFLKKTEKWLENEFVMPHAGKNMDTNLYWRSLITIHILIYIYVQFYLSSSVYISRSWTSTQII